MKKKSQFTTTKKLFLSFVMLFAIIGFVAAETVPYAKYAMEGATKVKIQSGTASSAQPGEDISRSFDGDKSTLYHSTYGSTPFPVTLTYVLSETSDLDYFVYTTRANQTNGNFMETDVLVSKNGSDFTKVLTKNFNGYSGSFKTYFEEKQTDIKAVRFIVRSGAGNFVSCAEMEFFKSEEGAFNSSSIFTDASCSEIKEGVTRTDLTEIINPYYRQLALDIFDNTYPTEFRIDNFKAWPHPDNFSSTNRVGTYSLCDNPTGIYARQGDTIMVFVDKLYNVPVSLTLKNYNKPEGNGYWENTYYGLNEGSNTIIADRDGLFYVFYHSTALYNTVSPVKIHFAYGKVNGYYDSQRHSTSDWGRLLNATNYEYFDALGKYAHLSYPTAKFKANAASNGAQLVQAYDDLVFMEREHMGYYKYPNRDPKNRSHFVVMYHSYMYSTSYHTGYEIGTMDGLTNLTNFKKYPWGPAHEVGHSNQTRPLLNWVGTTEVTNNIHSLLVQTNWGNTSRLIEENRYQNAYNNIISAHKPHADADVFEKLVPFWQLQLLFCNVLGQKDFYASIYEAARTRATGSNQGQYQTNFVKIVVDSAKYDLTEFLEAWGFLTPVNMLIDDYGAAQLSITAAQIRTLKTYITGKEFPKLPYAMQYITDNNWQIYKNKTEVVQGKAVRFGNTYRMQNWENVVAYEAYQGSELIKVSGDNQISFTNEVTDSTKIYAVQYDGTRIEVKADLEISVDNPEISDATTSHWYYIKNMGIETTNNNNNRSFTSLEATSNGAAVGATTTPMLKTQKWKLIDIDGKTGIVNEKGLYLGADMKATTSPYGWTVESITQGGSSGYRFASYTGTELSSVAHLNNSRTLINYTSADAASVWQFIPVETLKLSTENSEIYYAITTMSMESEFLGQNIAYDNENNSVSMEGDNIFWKITNYDASTGACNIVNKEGKYLKRSGTNIILSDDASASLFYIYMTTLNGVVGYRISPVTTSGGVMLNLTNKGVVNTSTLLSNNSLWQFRSKNVVTGLQKPVTHTLKAYAQNRQIVVENETNFDICNINGQKVANHNLPMGVYIVKTSQGVCKVMVK